MSTRIAYLGRVAYVAEALAIYRIHGANSEKPVTSAVYALFVASLAGLVRAGDRGRLRTVAAQRFLELLQEALRDHGVNAARKEFAVGVRSVDRDLLGKVLADRWLAADLLLGPRLARRIVGGYARGLRFIRRRAARPPAKGTDV